MARPSVDRPSTECRSITDRYFGQVSYNYRLNVGEVSVKYRWTKCYIGRHTSRPIYRTIIDRPSTDKVKVNRKIHNLSISIFLVAVNGGSQWGGPFDGWRLKISRFDGWRLNFRSFDGWRLIFRNDVYNTNLNPNLTVSLNETVCFFSYLNTGFNPIIGALKMRLLVFNYGNYVYY